MTNFDYRHFDPSKRVPVVLDKLGFRVLPMLFATGETYVRELEETRKAAKEKAEKTKMEGVAIHEGKKRKLGKLSLRERDPW